MKISVIDKPEIRNFSFTTKEGKQRDNTKQTIYADLGQRFPTQCEIDIESPAYAYPVGEYTYSPDSYEVDQYQNLVLKRFGRKLIPLKSSNPPPLPSDKR